MNEETQKALRIFYKLQNELQKTDDTIRLKQVNQIIAVLESSFYSKIVEINRSLSDLKRYKNIQADDIEIDVETGRFSVNKALSVESGRKRKSTAPGMTPRQPMSHEDFEKRIKLLCGTRELKHVQINKLSVAQPLGFSINCSNQNRGIFIEDVTPGGVADNCGIRVSDQIIAVDGVPLDDPDTNRTVALNALKSGQARIDLHLAKASVAITVSSSSQLSPSTIKDQGHLRNRSDIGLIRELTTEWTQYEIIELDSRQGSFGFGIAGGLSDGALVRTILSGGAADLEGRLQINDHLMYINEHSVRRLNTNQVADILKANSQHVTLIVARPYDQRSQLPGNGGRMQMVETENLDARLEMIVNQLRQEKLGGAARKSSEKNRFEANIQGERGSLASEMYRDESEDIIEHIVIELPRSNTSLGMSIARVCLEDSEHLGTLDGVFVRSVVPNGIADQAGVTKFDRVMKINGTLIDNRDMERSVQKLLSNHNKLDLEVQRYVSGPTLLLLLSNELHATDISVNDQLDNSDASSVDSCDGQQVQRQQPLYREFEINQYPSPLTLDERKQIGKQWKSVVGEEKDIVIADFSKYTEEGGLGISLEGTVDIDENGSELHPHHYVRAIVPNGPAGKNAILKERDELLEANGQSLYGLNHLDAVSILKHLSLSVRLICARDSNRDTSYDYSNKSVKDELAHLEEADRLCQDLDNIIAMETGVGISTTGGSVGNPVDSLSHYAAKSQDHLDDNGWHSNDNEYASGTLQSTRSRSVDHMQGMAIWDHNVTFINLEKKANGLGFSVLDYQDPVDPAQSVIVVRSLVPNGAAARDGRLLPGDRLMSVDGLDVSRSSMSEAVEVLKQTGSGPVRLGVVRALCLDDVGSQDDLQEDDLQDPIVVCTDEDEYGSSIDRTNLTDSSKLGCDIDSGHIESPRLPEETHPSKPSRALTTEKSMEEENMEEFILTPIIPAALEQKCKVNKLAGQKLGLVLEGEGSFGNNENGFLVRDFEKGSPMARATASSAMVAIGDFVTALVGQSIRDREESYMEEVLRKATLQAGDVKISFIPAADYQIFLQSKNMQAAYK